MADKTKGRSEFTRRQAVLAGAGIAGASMIPSLLPRIAMAQTAPAAVGTYPAGTAGTTVNIGAVIPRTGTYAVQGEDELKGMQLAIDHINGGDPLIKAIAPKVTKGLLGKQVALVVADSAANANMAVQEEQTFIAQNKIIAMTGSTSSAVAVALNAFAQQQKVIYLVAISGSNDTTGMNCARYSFRQCFYGDTAAAAIGPQMVKAYGKNRKAAFMTPDYTYGHTVTKAVNDYLTQQAGWTQVTDQVSPLGSTDFSQYLTNIANSGAEFIINVNWGNDGVLSTQQAKQFGLIPKMQLVIPYQIPFLAKLVTPDLTAGVLAATDYWWTMQDMMDASGKPRFPLAKQFNDAFNAKYMYQPEWGAENGYMQFAIWARMISEAGTFNPPDVIKQYEKGDTFPSFVGDVHFRAEDHQLVRPVVIVQGKKPADMKNPQDYWNVVDVLPGDALMKSATANMCMLGTYT